MSSDRGIMALGAGLVALAGAGAYYAFGAPPPAPAVFALSKASGRKECVKTAKCGSTAYPTIDCLVGNTPLVRLRHLNGEKNTNTILVKLEGNNPTLSVKARAAFYMIQKAEERGRIKPGDTLVEATSGNTGIALCAAAAIKGYKMTIVMPAGASAERQQSMTAYGATLVLVPGEGGIEAARDLALQMQDEGKGIVLDQFNNPDNVAAHYEGTGPEIWRDTHGQVTHFVSSMGTTGTIMGVSKYLKEKNPDVKIIGAQPTEGSKIPGIRKWPKEMVPGICDFDRIDRMIYVSQEDAEDTARALALREGIFCGVSAGGALWCALEVAKVAENATIVVVLPDWGDRYLSTGVYSKNSEAQVIMAPEMGKKYK